MSASVQAGPVDSAAVLLLDVSMNPPSEGSPLDDVPVVVVPDEPALVVLVLLSPAGSSLHAVTSDTNNTARRRKARICARDCSRRVEPPAKTG